MSIEEEIQEVEIWEKNSASNLKNEMERYFETYKYYEKTMTDAEFEKFNIIITRRK